MLEPWSRQCEKYAPVDPVSDITYIAIQLDTTQFALDVPSRHGELQHLHPFVMVMALNQGPWRVTASCQGISLAAAGSFAQVDYFTEMFVARNSKSNARRGGLSPEQVQPCRAQKASIRRNSESVLDQANTQVGTNSRRAYK